MSSIAKNPVGFVASAVAMGLGLYGILVEDLSIAKFFLILVPFSVAGLVYDYSKEGAESFTKYWMAPAVAWPVLLVALLAQFRILVGCTFPRGFAKLTYIQSVMLTFSQSGMKKARAERMTATADCLSHHTTNR